MGDNVEMKGGSHAPARERTRLEALLRERMRPLARSVLHWSWSPGPVVKGLFASAYHAHDLSREAIDWGVRSAWRRTDRAEPSVPQPHSARILVTDPSGGVHPSVSAAKAGGVA